MFRVRNLPLRAWAACAAAAWLGGCAANCLRDSDCDDAHVCLHDRCVLPAASAPDASGQSGGSAGQAGGSSLPPRSETGGAGGFGGSATAPSVGGSSQDPRENLDASADADAASN